MTAPVHRIFGRPLDVAIPKGFDQAIFGMGCYWGVERLFWQLEGVWLTEVGFAGGTLPNPSYEQVCAGTTGQAEVVRLVYDSSRISYERLLQAFWENHDPTQGNRQGNDVGSQYRSLIMYFTDSQRAAAERARADYGNRLAVGSFPRSPRRSCRRAPSIRPMPITSNIWTAIPMAIAACAAPVSKRM